MEVKIILKIFGRTDLRIDIQQSISVGVYDWRDVRDPVVHVASHHLNLLVEVGLGVDILDLLVHLAPHQLSLGLDKVLVEDVGSYDDDEDDVEEEKVHDFFYLR